MVNSYIKGSSGESLDLRLLNCSDADLLYSFNSSIDHLAYIPRTPFKSIGEAEALLAKFLKSMDEKTSIWWAITNINTGKAVGYTGVFGIDRENHSAEIGYGLLKNSWGKGFASSIVGYVTSFGFSELQLHRTYGLVDPENKASIRVLEKNGYIKEGLMRDYFYARGRYFDMCMMAKIESTLQ